MKSPSLILTSSDFVLDTSILRYAEKLHRNERTGKFRPSNPWVFLMLLFCASIFAIQRSNLGLNRSETPASVQWIGLSLSDFIRSHPSRLNRVFFEEGGKP